MNSNGEREKEFVPTDGGQQTPDSPNNQVELIVKCTTCNILVHSGIMIDPPIINSKMKLNLEIICENGHTTTWKWGY